METTSQLTKSEIKEYKIEGEKEGKIHPIFNKEYEILRSLGDGKTSKVYLCKSIKDPENKVAMKLLREEFLQKDEKNVKSVEKEI
jgi:serine/threonine protein kinase